MLLSKIAKTLYMCYGVKSLTFSVTNNLLEIFFTTPTGVSSWSIVLLLSGFNRRALHDISWIVCDTRSGLTDWLRPRVPGWFRWAASASEDHDFLRIGFFIETTRYSKHRTWLYHISVNKRLFFYFCFNLNKLEVHMSLYRSSCKKIYLIAYCSREAVMFLTIW